MLEPEEHHLEKSKAFRRPERADYRIKREFCQYLSQCKQFQAWSVFQISFSAQREPDALLETSVLEESHQQR